MTNSAEFRTELKGLLKKYSLDKSVGVPDYILADLLIMSLSTHQIVVKATTEFYAKDVRTSLLFDPTPLPPPPIRRHIIFAESRAQATEWAYQHMVFNWITVQGVKTIRGLQEKEEIKTIKDYEVIELGDWSRTRPELVEALRLLEQLRATPIPD